LRSRRVDRWTRTAAPSFGADNRAILAELGYDDARVDALHAAGVVSDTI
jgi:crotonobetainyl-CoA:carnitine CoA-transferase CaiB-like acyl-CoA transferase